MRIITGFYNYKRKEERTRMKKGFWDLPILNSRTDKKNITIWEMICGYFLGPLGVITMAAVVSTYYITFYRTYDDIVAQGTFLKLLPLISVIPMALSNIIVGILLGKTRTPQGKARPYILAAAPLLLVSGILVFCIPYFSLGFRMVWIALTFNLFASVANPIYGTAHYLMVSVSTRDLKQRGTLSVVANIPAVAANGLMSSIVMPLILAWTRSAPSNDITQNRWQMIAVIFSVIAFIGCILEYKFTRERITEEDFLEMDSPAVKVEEPPQIPAAQQIKSAMKDKYWWCIIIFYALFQAGNMFKGGAIFNIFVNEYFTQTTIFGIQMGADQIQSVLALISGIPLAAGMLFIWPLANKFGKRNMVIAGMVISIIGSIVCWMGPGSFAIMLIGQTLKGFSSIPGAYIMMAIFADVLDHLEARFGYRVDGVSMSVYNALITVVNGLALSFFLLFYDNPALNSSFVAKFFFVGYEVIAHAILIVVLLNLNVEKNIEAEQKLIAERKAKIA